MWSYLEHFENYGGTWVYIYILVELDTFQECQNVTEESAYTEVISK